MCGRLSIHNLNAVRDLTDMLSIPQERLDLAGVEARYNTLPTQQLPVIWSDGDALAVSSMQWGWLKNKAKYQGGSARHINAKSETVFELPTFRHAARQARCVIVANGYFEWRRDFQDRPLEPHYIHPREQNWLAIAGIYHPAVGTHRECALLTMTPNQSLGAIHHRMPCMLDLDGIGAWLAADTPERAARALRVAAEDFVVECPVSDQVNKVSNDGPDLIIPVLPPPRQTDWLNG